MNEAGTITYATCPVCGKEMLPGDGCGQTDLYIGKRKYARVRNMDYPGGNCHDCNAGVGHVHHWNCDMERCPKCGLQLLSCFCKSVTIEPRR